MYTESRINRNTAQPSQWQASPPDEYDQDDISQMRSTGTLRLFALSSLTRDTIAPCLEGQFLSESNNRVHLAHRLQEKAETTSSASTLRTTPPKEGRWRTEDQECEHAHGGIVSPKLASFAANHAHPTTTENTGLEDNLWNLTFNNTKRSQM